MGAKTHRGEFKPPCLPVAGMAVPVGYAEQRRRLLNAGADDSRWLNLAIMAQPCRPSRRQQAGSLASGLGDSAGAISEMLRTAINKNVHALCKFHRTVEN